MNWSGDSHDAYSVIIDSALGVLGAPPKRNDEFLGQVKWLQEYLRNAPPPKYPFAIDAARAEAGKAVFETTLRGLPRERQDRPAHAARRRSAPTGDGWTPGTRTTPSPRTRWSAAMGIERKGLVEAPLDGYNPPFLDGVWVRAPYLHNGSVPTLRDLLEPPAKRPKVFWRGYDLYDQVERRLRIAGTDEAQAHRHAVRHEPAGQRQRRARVRRPICRQRDKDALLEYLKTL